jgi:hypothetical protein
MAITGVEDAIRRAKAYEAAGVDAMFLEHDPEKACPGRDPGWVPVFGKDHAQTIG